MANINQIKSNNKINFLREIKNKKKGYSENLNIQLSDMWTFVFIHPLENIKG